MVIDPIFHSEHHSAMTSPMGYADDVIITGPPPHVSATIRYWLSLLAPFGLRINPDKCALFDGEVDLRMQITDSFVLVSKAQPFSCKVFGFPFNTSNKHNKTNFFHTCSFIVRRCVSRCWPSPYHAIPRQLLSMTSSLSYYAPFCELSATRLKQLDIMVTQLFYRHPGKLHVGWLPTCAIDFIRRGNAIHHPQQRPPQTCEPLLSGVPPAERFTIIPTTTPCV